MIGVPKRYNTATDLENAHALALEGRLPAAPIRRAWEALLNTQKVYVFNQVLVSKDDRTGPEPDYRVLTGQGENENEIHEYRLVDDPNGRINKLGYIPSEVKTKISELE
jgi:hypothetical protein